MTQHHQKEKHEMEEHHHDPWEKVTTISITVFKVLAVLVGVLTLPLLLLQAVLFPLRIIFIFKALMFFNTILIGTFIYRAMLGDGFSLPFKNFSFTRPVMPSDNNNHRNETQTTMNQQSRKLRRNLGVRKKRKFTNK